MRHRRPVRSTGSPPPAGRKQKQNEYKSPCTFGEEISIAVSVESFNGVILTIVYDMRNQKGETVCSARSEHVFMNREGRFVRMRRDMPEFCQAIDNVMSKEKAE